MIPIFHFQKPRCKNSEVTSATITGFQGGPNDGSRQKWAKPVMPVIRVHQFAEIEVEFEREYFNEKALIGWAVYEVRGNVA